MHKTSLQAHKDELVFFDETNPRALVRLVPDAFAAQMQVLRHSPEGAHLGLSEVHLKKLLIRNGKCPTPLDNRIRLQFWMEYDRFQREEEKRTGSAMNFSYIIGFAISKEYFYSHYIQCKYAMLWLLCPPTNYVTVLEDTLRHANDRLNEVLMAGIHVTGSSHYDMQFLQFVLKVHEKLTQQLRTMGALPRLAPGRIKTVHDDPVSNAETDAHQEAQMKEIEREQKRMKIKKLRAQIEEEKAFESKVARPE